MSVGLWSILADTGPFARAILVILLIFSIVSWAIMVERARFFRRLRRDAERFLRSSRKAATLADLYALAGRERGNPLARLCLAGQRELAARSGLGEPSTPGAAGAELAAIRRALESAAIEETARFEGALAFLATAGSVTPFVGLLGTVWGVMSAFADMGRQGQANLAVVAPGIAEALIATAAGLATAIPAVMGYNYFVGRVRAGSSLLEAFSLEFLNRIERERGS